MGGGGRTCEKSEKSRDYSFLGSKLLHMGLYVKRGYLPASFMQTKKSADRDFLPNTIDKAKLHLSPCSNVLLYY